MTRQQMSEQQPAAEKCAPTPTEEQTVVQETATLPSAPPAPCDSEKLSMIMENMTNMTLIVQTMASKLDSNSDQMNDLVTLNTQLMNDNDALRKSVTDLTTRLSQISWKSFTQPRPRSDLLIGSSLIRNIDKDKLTDTDVICKPGGTIDTVTKELERVKDYDTITMVVGGNDCDREIPVPAAKIVESYHKLIQKACQKANKVTVSSICPRMKSDSTHATINSVNAELLATCTDNEQVTFVDSTPSFMLGDGSVNDGYLLPDGVHLTRPAVNRLAKNLKLNAKSQAEGVYKDQPRKTVTKTKNTKPQLTKQHNDWQVVSNKRQQRQPTTQYNTRNESRRTTNNYETERCTFCYETGHNSTTCRHGQPVECHHCRYTGHKAKFCQSSY